MRNKKINYIIMFLVIIGFSIAPAVNSIKANNPTTQQLTENKIQLYQEFSKPVLKKENNNLEISVKETDEITTNQGYPEIPVFIKTYELPWGTEITDINPKISDIKSIKIDDKIKTIPLYKSAIYSETTQNEEIITNNDEAYPNSWYTYEKGVGINKNGLHVLFLSFHIYPVRYHPSKNCVEYIQNININIKFDYTQTEKHSSALYDLVIITPSMFSSNLQPLITHKEMFGVKTNLTTLEHIYNYYPGNDNCEQIKYFIKYALEEWKISYVLLVGDIKKLPIRTTDAYPWDEFHGSGILTDLYYADIYNESFEFCSWDGNNNGTFGEVEYYSEEHQHAYRTTNVDEVDLYPDVHIGRLACRSNKEVDIVVDKIIHYERDTYDDLWFKKIILAGGDTFPPGKGSAQNLFEGEITNQKVAQQLPDFQHIKLWSSKYNLNFITFNNAINQGAGFLTYAGHGFEHGWGTYKPNALNEKMDITNPLYYTFFIKYLKNKYKLPIMFFDACLTAKLDFNMNDLQSYYKFLKIIIWFLGVDYDSTNYYPCFAWCFVMKNHGGAIATIGATRPAFTFVDQNGVHAGAGYLDWQFFKAYEEETTVGEMFTTAQTAYLNNIGIDFFTIEEFILLGDPSLKVGGYP